MVNSPTNPFSSGRPAELSIAMANTTANFGITCARPPYSVIARVPALVDDADDQEQHAGRDAVIDLLQHAARDAVGVQRENAQRAEAQVAHRRIRDQLLPIRLHQADQRAVDDPDDESTTSILTTQGVEEACGASGSEKRRNP